MEAQLVFQDGQWVVALAQPGDDPDEAACRQLGQILTIEAPDENTGSTYSGFSEGGPEQGAETPFRLLRDSGQGLVAEFGILPPGFYKNDSDNEENSTDFEGRNVYGGAQHQQFMSAMLGSNKAEISASNQESSDEDDGDYSLNRDSSDFRRRGWEGLDDKRKYEIARYGFKKGTGRATEHFSKKFGFQVTYSQVARVQRKYTLLSEILQKQPSMEEFRHHKNPALTQEQKDQLVEYCIEHGPVATANYFSPKWKVLLHESTIRGLVKKAKK